MLAKSNTPLGWRMCFNGHEFDEWVKGQDLESVEGNEDTTLTLETDVTPIGYAVVSPTGRSETEPALQNLPSENQDDDLLARIGVAAPTDPTDDPCEPILTMPDIDPSNEA